MPSVSSEKQRRDSAFWNTRKQNCSKTQKTGVVVSFLQSPYAIIGFCEAPFFVVLGTLIADGRKNKKQEGPKQP